MRRIAALVLAGLLGAAGTAALAGPAGAGAPGPYPADALIKIKGVTGFVGDGLFDTPDAVGQTLSTAASPAQKAVFVIRAQNEKFQRSRIDAWVDYADCDFGPGDIDFFYNGENVSEEMFNDDFRVKNVPAGGYFDVKMKIKVSPGAECFVVVGVESHKFDGDADYVIGEVFSTQGGGFM